MVVKKKIVQNALCDEIPANTFCLSASNEQFVYSDEFPALPSNNAFLSLPTIDSVCFTSPAYSFVSTLTKLVSSLSQPLLSKTVSSASLQFPLPQGSRPIISSNSSFQICSLPVPATESELLHFLSIYLNVLVSLLLLKLHFLTLFLQCLHMLLSLNFLLLLLSLHFLVLCLPCLYLLLSLKFPLHFLNPYLDIPIVKVDHCIFESNV
ncbi:hypothetical protein AVEN_242068-1 [Araneus ventricosus]|uniref:Uncharacterized protein n=1 Tax=Araneus ventricosus TaxID=182803 RepID=A0A4Y2V0G1_ARAVE|nr:hypothetical protein AVEN_242068-1 [Araneus ventricosus]